MTSPNAAFLRQIIRTTPELFGRIVQFNFRPARYLHRERVRTLMNVELFSRLIAHPRGEARLSERIAALWNLDSVGCYDFEQPRSRLALLSPQTLDTLFRMCGLALAGPEIAREIRRDEIRAFRQEFTAEDYQFAVKRASTLAGSGPADLAVPPQTGETLAQLVQHNRRRMIACCLAGVSPALSSRLVLKLPPADEPSRDETVTPDQCEAAWRTLHKIAMAEQLDGEVSCSK